MDEDRGGLVGNRGTHMSQNLMREKWKYELETTLSM